MTICQFSSVTCFYLVILLLSILGHTHYQVCDQEKEPWVVNPGACGHTRNNDGGPCFMQIEINDDDEWKIIPYCFN